MSAWEKKAWVPLAVVIRSDPQSATWTAAAPPSPGLQPRVTWPDPGLLRAVKADTLAVVKRQTSRATRWDHRDENTWVLLIRYAVGLGDCPPGWGERPALKVEAETAAEIVERESGGQP